MCRIETDGLGSRQLPKDALYGIHSLRASENFPISGRGMDAEFIRNLVLIKKAAALVNGEIGDLPAQCASAIVWACNELLAGRYLDAFILDAMQGGAGTSENMNANEVIANLAIKHLGGDYGEYSRIHPIDHVNMYQSTNDVIPTAGRMTAHQKCGRLIMALDGLRTTLLKKAAAFDGILKVGRTQLQDAVPMRVGQSFSAWASMADRSIRQIRSVSSLLLRVNLGATAIGTSINVSSGYFDRILPQLSEESGLQLSRLDNLFDGTQNTDDFVAISSAVKVCAVGLSKLASDLRLLSSGPNSGFRELLLPPMQGGSSIMPGKVNPVIPEAINQAAFLVIGHDLTITQAAESGQLELNAFLPVILFQLFEEIDILRNAVTILDKKCVEGICVNEAVCREEINKCDSIVTALNPLIGYDKSASIVQSARQRGRSVLKAARVESGLSDKQLDELLDPYKLTSMLKK